MTGEDVPEEPADSGAPAARPWFRDRRRVLVVGAIVAVAAVVWVAAIVATGHGDAEDTLDDVGGPVGAARTADRVPYGPALRDAPYDCGISPAVLDRVAGDAAKQESQGAGSDRCTWDDLSADLHNELEVDLSIASAEGGRPDPAAAVEDFRDVIENRPSEPDSHNGPVTGLSGLGAEAVGWTTVESDDTKTPLKDHGHPGVWHGTAGTVIAFRAGNVTAQVTYAADAPKGGVDLTKHPLDPATRDRALTVVTSVARTVGAPVHGAVSELPRPAGPWVRTIPAACSVAPAGVVRDARDDARLKPRHEDGSIFVRDASDDDVTADRCAWSEYEYGPGVDIEWMRIDGTARGDPSSAARRAYVQRYRDARDNRGGGVVVSLFTPLKGLGDEAFARYQKGRDGGADDAGGEGTVLVRKRNAVLAVRCWTVDGIYRPNDALNCAYKVARAAADRVRA